MTDGLSVFRLQHSIQYNKDKYCLMKCKEDEGFMHFQKKENSFDLFFALKKSIHTLSSTILTWRLIYICMYMYSAYRFILQK